jgi:hypothetical protein
MTLENDMEMPRTWKKNKLLALRCDVASTARVHRRRATHLIAIAASILWPSVWCLAAGPQAAPDPLAESALSATMGAGDAATKQRAVAAANLRIRTRAAQVPNGLSKAHVVLGRGFSPTELQSLLGASVLEVVQVEAKIPVPNSSEVYTVFLQGAALEEVAGGVATRVAAALSSTQREFQERADADPTSRTKFTALAHGKLLIYAFESIGTNAAHAALADSHDVQVVQSIHSEDPEKEAKGQRALRQSLRQERSSTSTSMSSVSLASSGDPTPPTTPLPIPTGDPFIDAALVGSVQFMDGDVDTTPRNKDNLPGEAYLGCKQTLDQYHCPNDYAYTARGATGGTSEFNVGYRRYGGPVNTVECGLTYTPPDYQGVFGSYAWSCRLLPVTFPRRTYVTAVSEFSFGNMRVNILVNPFTSETHSAQISTYAWQGFPQDLYGYNGVCMPVGDPNEPSRPCDITTENENYVQGQSGFEDKVLVPNPACTTFRTGAAIDKSNYCFTSDKVVTNLPTAYLDTTFSDPSDTYVASVGVRDGKQLLNVIYESTIYGSMSGWENAKGLYFHHFQAVTVRDTSGISCITGVGGALAGSDAACMFNVDLAEVGKKHQVR